MITEFASIRTIGHYQFQNLHAVPFHMEYSMYGPNWGNLRKYKSNILIFSGNWSKI